MPFAAMSAPYADLVIDARTGQVLHETNADTRLHPASLTKMMTLYIAFEAIEHGEISLDSQVTISQNAAAEPPSKLGLKAGQKIALRYLIRAAAIKSANDAATAIGEAIEGSESAFANRMNRTAKALGMTRTTFRNANGLTAEGHLSTARDMTTLGRRVFFDYPQYYNLFSRRTADAGMKQVNSTNRRFLDSYKGADGIKTGYTTPAGFNLVASAERGNTRIIATVFGGKSTASRNARVAELLDLGFGKAPRKAIVQKPAMPVYTAQAEPDDSDSVSVSGIGTTSAGKTLRLARAIAKSPRPLPRPEKSTEPMLLALQDDINAALVEAHAGAEDVAEDAAEPLVMADMANDPANDPTPQPDPATQAETAAPDLPVFEQTTAPQPETLLAQSDLIAADPDILEIDAPATPDPVIAAIASAIAPETSPRPAVSPIRLALADAATETVAVTPASLVSPSPDIPAPTETVINAPIEPNTTPLPAIRPEQVVLVAFSAPEPVAADLETVTRVSTSGGREWAINVGRFNNRYNAERMLLQTALIEMNTLDEALRKVVNRKGGFDANFVGMTHEMAELACRRLQARQTECKVIGP
ncbi:MAG: serine hydrolase [Albidovulum sp.]